MISCGKFQGFFLRDKPVWENERKKGIYRYSMYFSYASAVFLSSNIYLFFFKLEISKSTNWKTASKTHYQAKIIAYLCRYFRFFFSLCCLYSALCFFAVMSHLTKFAWFYFPFHSIGGGRGFKLIWKKIPCFINVCKTNAFPNNSAAALIDKQTDIQFAIMAVFSLYCIRIEWLFFTPSTFGIWYVYISYMFIIYVGRFCVCVFQYSSFDDEKNYICF